MAVLEPIPEPLSKPVTGLGSFLTFIAGLRTSCGPNWYTGGSNNSSYILALFVTCFVMPLSLILFSYTNLLLTLRAVSAPSSGESALFRSQSVPIGMKSLRSGLGDSHQSWHLLVLPSGLPRDGSAVPSC